ncbi:unknown protein [Simkania negevensis Z]|uniref:Uncharacterized protein n=1 Tax=Simkania negevensis (strain ATCC VR-1471 / DSM 27360 / Z) TaxID=331113 RepID=F8L7V1_SIMNZ|nr:unknown protein [Simkania negevensis Z]
MRIYDKKSYTWAFIDHHLGFKATTGGFVEFFKKFWLFFEEVARLRGEMFLEDR